MSDTSIEQRILTLLQERLKGEWTPVDHETRLYEIGDSLDRVEAIMELEDEFEISIPDDEAQRIETIGELIDYIEHRLAAPSGAGGPQGAPPGATPNAEST